MIQGNFVLQQNVPLAPLTTFGIGGPARYFTRVENIDDLRDALDFAKTENVGAFILGGGSNVLVSDQGFDGIVIQIAFRGVDTIEDNFGKVELTVSAGEEWDVFVEHCVERDYGGIECLSGIPGLVGGTPVQNVGAYGQDVSETILDVTVYDRESGSETVLSNVECGFAYRGSIFNTVARDRYIVLSVRFLLTKAGKPNVGYRDLRDQFVGKIPTLAEVRRAVLEIRRAKSMVIDPGDPNSRSAGSFFKNPIVSREVYEKIDQRLEHVPSFEVDALHVKIPAAWLIETAGFRKGYVRGNAGISSNHTLALINTGGASALDIIALKNEIQAAVFSAFGIALTPEPVFVGFPVP